MVTPTPDQREDYEERAAILEFEANLPRPEAERLAAEMCFPHPRTQGELFVPQYRRQAIHRTSGTPAQCSDSNNAPHQPVVRRRHYRN